MKYSEFKEQVIQSYHKEFPNSLCSVSTSSLGKDSIFVQWYLANDKSEEPNNYFDNDMFRIIFFITDATKASYENRESINEDTELPENLIMEISHNSVLTKPDNKYMAYSSISLPFRKTKGSPEKIIATLERYANNLKNSIYTLWIEDKIADTHKELVAKKIDKDIDKKIEEGKELGLMNETVSISGLPEDAVNIAEEFKNYKSFENNFEPLIIVKQNGHYWIYKATAQNYDDYINHSDSKDYIEGWLYGAVQAANKRFTYTNKKVNESKVITEDRIPDAELPDMCYNYVESEHEIGIIKKGVEGYYVSKVDAENMTPEEAKAYVQQQNKLLEVTPEQQTQMVLKSMFGWDNKVEEDKKISKEEWNDVKLAIQEILDLLNNNELIDEEKEEVSECCKWVVNKGKEYNLDLTEEDVLNAVKNNKDNILTIIATLGFAGNLNESKTSTEEYWDATLIDGKVFKELLKFNFGTDSHGNNYIVTNDVNEIGRFYAKSDKEAIDIFRKEYIK